MGGVIGFSNKPEEIWFAAGWAFRQVLDDVISQFPEDLEMYEVFSDAKHHGGLNIDLLSPEFSIRITEALREVAMAILCGSVKSGIVDKPYGDAKTVEQYQEVLRQLVDLISAYNVSGHDTCDDRKTKGTDNFEAK